MDGGETGLEKAYDRVDWNFLEKVVSTLGFSTIIVKHFMFSIRSAKLAMLWNGKKLDEFSPSLGLRQGGPLSPYLFVLCVEILVQGIQDTVTSGIWQLIQLSRGGLHLSHLFFADDLVLFGTATTDQATIMEQVIRDFCSMLGQKVSMSKSRLFVFGNVPASAALSLSQLMGIEVAKNLENYLGMPLLHYRVRKSTFSFLVDKVGRKLWDEKLSFYRGQLRLYLFGLLATIPRYAM